MEERNIEFVLEPKQKVILLSNTKRSEVVNKGPNSVTVEFKRVEGVCVMKMREEEEQ